MRLTRSGKRSTGVGVVAVLVLGLALPASAHVQSKYDGSDTNGPLDIMWSEFSHGHGKNDWSKSVRVWLCAYTQRRWRTGVLRRNAIYFELDTRGDTAPDYYAVFRPRGNRLGGDLITARTETKRRIGGYRYGGKRGGCVYFKRRHIRPIKQFVRWQGVTSFRSRRECRRQCFDFTRRYRHYNV